MFAQSPSSWRCLRQTSFHTVISPHLDVQMTTPIHTSSCVQHAAKGNLLHQRIKAHSLTLIYLSMCVGESTKQQRVDDNVPRQTLRGITRAA